MSSFPSLLSQACTLFFFTCSWDVLRCCQLMSNCVLLYTSGSLLYRHIPFPCLWSLPPPYVHPSLRYSSSFSRLLISLLKTIWPLHLSSPPSPAPSLPSSLPSSTYLSFTFTRCQHTPSSPPPALISLLSFSPSVCSSTHYLCILLFTFIHSFQTTYRLPLYVLLIMHCAIINNQ